MLPPLKKDEREELREEIEASDVTDDCVEERVVEGPWEEAEESGDDADGLCSLELVEAAEDMCSRGAGDGPSKWTVRSHTDSSSSEMGCSKGWNGVCAERGWGGGSHGRSCNVRAPFSVGPVDRADELLLSDQMGKTGGASCRRVQRISRAAQSCAGRNAPGYSAVRQVPGAAVKS